MCSFRSVLFVIPMFAATLIAPCLAAAQSLSGNYQNLFPEAQQLIDELAGNAQPSRFYNNLDESKRSTFEGAVHALQNMGILDLIESVTAIWGVRAGNDGRHQYRISVQLKENSALALWDHPDFDPSFFGHVKLPDGNVVGGAPPLFGLRSCDGVRGKSPHAKLHISWLEENTAVGEVDIDYRPLAADSHVEPANSDIRAHRRDGRLHYDLHVDVYGPDLERWWRP